MKEACVLLRRGQHQGHVKRYAHWDIDGVLMVAGGMDTVMDWRMDQTNESHPNEGSLSEIRKRLIGGHIDTSFIIST